MLAGLSGSSVEANEPLNPIAVQLLDTYAVVVVPVEGSDLVQRPNKPQRRQQHGSLNGQIEVPRFTDF